MDMIGSYETKKSHLECPNVEYLMIQPHLHAEWEHVICLSGSSTVHIIDAALQLNPGEMVLAAPDYQALIFSDISALTAKLPALKKF